MDLLAAYFAYPNRRATASNKPPRRTSCAVQDSFIHRAGTELQYEEKPRTFREGD
jgi:hypothetical protein